MFRPCRTGHHDPDLVRRGTPSGARSRRLQLVTSGLAAVAAEGVRVEQRETARRCPLDAVITEAALRELVYVNSLLKTEEAPLPGGQSGRR